MPPTVTNTMTDHNTTETAHNDAGDDPKTLDPEHYADIQESPATGKAVWADAQSGKVLLTTDSSLDLADWC